MKKLLIASSLILALTGTMKAQATTIDAEFNGYKYNWSSNISYNLNGTAGTTGAGLFSFTDTNSMEEFLAFCIELTQSISSGSITYNVFPGTDENPDGLANSATMVDENGYVTALYSNALSNVNDAETAAAFQVALWVLTHEDLDANGFNLTDGLFQLTGSTAAVNSYATSFLSTASNGVNNVNVDVLRSEISQDQLVVTQVSEPTTLAILGLSMLGLSLAKRRKSLV